MTTGTPEARNFEGIVRGRTVLTKWYRMVLENDAGDSKPLAPICPVLHELQSSRELVEQRHHGPAMATAAAVSDAYFTEAIAALLMASDSPGGDDPEPGGYVLSRAQHLAIYRDLSGDDLRQAPFWSAYKRGRAVRGKWAHGLQGLGRAQSEPFVLAVADLIAHVERVLEERGVKSPPTEVGQIAIEPEGGYAMDFRRRRGA